jgi:hypothetical protein
VSWRRRTVSKPKRLSSWLKTRMGRVSSGGRTRGKRSRQVARKVARASGCFGVTGPWDLELGVELGADDGVEGVIVDLPVIGRLDPLAQGFVRGKAGGLLERLLNGGQDVGRQREGFTS